MKIIYLIIILNVCKDLGTPEAIMRSYMLTAEYSLPAWELNLSQLAMESFDQKNV
jgi:hypothetical protein